TLAIVVVMLRPLVVVPRRASDSPDSCSCGFVSCCRVHSPFANRFSMPIFTSLGSRDRPSRSCPAYRGSPPAGHFHLDRLSRFEPLVRLIGQCRPLNERRNTMSTKKKPVHEV